MRDLDNNNRLRRLPHGYCNETSRDGDLVVKRFLGPDAAARADTEARILRAVAAVVPVPAVTNVTDTEVTSRFVPGRHGQEVLTPDLASGVLAACGRTLAGVHAVPLPAVASRDSKNGVLVHGDYGPQNLLFDTATMSVTAVLDWEWAHIGHPVEDLAWCEWIVRTHHADCVDALPHLYYGYGEPMPPWQRRQSAMLGKCRAMQQFGARRKDGSASLWQRRAAVTAAWRA